MKKERLIHFDLLRIVACFSVVMLHSAAQFWYDIPVTSKEWFIINSYDAVVRFGVPIFVMISGALFLDNGQEISIKRLYKHNILRMIIVYIVWSVVYGFYDCWNSWSVIHIGDILREIFAGRYHLWYIPMSVGLYMLVPILKRWLCNAEKREVEYFIGLFFVFQIMQTTMESIGMPEIVGFLWETVDVEIVCSYLGYFILGYYIVHYGIDAKYNKWIYVSGFIGIIVNVIISYYLALRADAPLGVFYDSFGLFTFFIVLALFVFFENNVSRFQFSENKRKVIKELSADTLGIYLMHVGIMEILSCQGYHSMVVTPVVGVPFIAIICFVICFILAALLRRIPWIGRYIC